MTIYVDKITSYPNSMIPLAARRWGSKWSHLWTDKDPEELHLMAKAIGLRRSHYQESTLLPHYDIIPSKRSRAIRLGAVVSTVRDFLK